MSFFDKIVKKLFPADKVTNGKEAFVSEELTRNEPYKQAYFRWINEGAYKPLLHDVHEAYQHKLQKNEVTLKLHLLTTPYANGFALSYHATIGEKEFNYLFDYLKDQVINAGYQLNNSSRKIYDKPNYIETKEKYYLKPPLKGLDDGTLFDQMYGNISIENILIDGKPSYMKLVASIYSDRLYTKALPFQSLVDILFSK